MKKSEISTLRNLGPASEEWLNQVGIYTKKDLEKLGAQGAFEKVRAAGFNPSKNLLYALIGAIEDLSWKEVVEGVKEEERLEKEFSEN